MVGRLHGSGALAGTAKGRKGARAPDARLLFAAAAAIFISGCAAVDSTKITLVVEPATQICGASDREAPIRMTVRNASQGELRIWIAPNLRRPPYQLSWLGYQVLDDSGSVDWEHGPGGHGPLPYTLSIGPGDSTEVTGSIYNLAPANYGKSFKIQLKDRDDHVFVSSPFKACVAK